MTTSSDFQSRAAAAASRALSASNPAEALARSLTSDVPKITTAVKSYMSLVAARSLSTSPTDDAAAAAANGDRQTEDEKGNKMPRRPRATFRRTDNPNKAALLCARALLSAVNSAVILPHDDDGAGAGETKMTNDDGGKEEEAALDESSVDARLERDVVRIVWNGLVKKAGEANSSSGSAGGGGGGAGGDHKPSKVLGRRCLVYAYPHVLRRLQEKRDGGADGSPEGVDRDEAMVFFEEFGVLLASAGASNPQGLGPNDEDDDGALLWSADGGAAELARRRERRVRRGKEAVEQAEARARGDVATAVTEGLDGRGVGTSSSVTIEEIREDGEEEDKGAPGNGR